MQKATAKSTLALMLVAMAMIASTGTAIGADITVGPGPISAEIESAPGATPLKAEGADEHFDRVARNPYGCWGYSDNPHLSSHVPGSVAGQARTECSDATDQVKLIYVKAYLFRWRWYGWQRLASASSGKPYDAGKVKNSAAWTCTGSGTYRYATRGFHQVRDETSTYRGYTWKKAPSKITC